MSTHFVQGRVPVEGGIPNHQAPYVGDEEFLGSLFLDVLELQFWKCLRNERKKEEGAVN